MGGREACLCLRRPPLTSDLTFTHCFLHTYFLPDCDVVIKPTHTHSHSMINRETMTTPLVMGFVFLHIPSLPLQFGSHKEEVIETNK